MELNWKMLETNHHCFPDWLEPSPLSAALKAGKGPCSRHMRVWCLFFHYQRLIHETHSAHRYKERCRASAWAAWTFPSVTVAAHTTDRRGKISVTIARLTKKMPTFLKNLLVPISVSICMESRGHLGLVGLVRRRVCPARSVLRYVLLGRDLRVLLSS